MKKSKKRKIIVVERATKKGDFSCFLEATIDDKGIIYVEKCLQKELKECPFCGNINAETGNVHYDTDCMICRSCGASGPDTDGYNWNTRTSLTRSEVVEMLPEKKEIDHSKSDFVNNSIDAIYGYNQAINDMKAAIEKVRTV